MNTGACHPTLEVGRISIEEFNWAASPVHHRDCSHCRSHTYIYVIIENFCYTRAVVLTLIDRHFRCSFTKAHSRPPWLLQSHCYPAVESVHKPVSYHLLPWPMLTYVTFRDWIISFHWNRLCRHPQWLGRSKPTPCLCFFFPWRIISVIMLFFLSPSLVSLRR